jgi:hypothetical protein
MKAWFSLLKARTFLLFAAVIVVVGLMPVLYFVGLFGWQLVNLFQAGGSWVPLPATLLFTDHAPLQGGKAAPVLALIPQFQWPWFTSPESWLPAHVALTWVLSRVHVGLAFALAGLAVMALATASALRQTAAIRAWKQRYKDRLRRVRDYQREASQMDALDRREPFIGAGAIPRNADRRVA